MPDTDTILLVDDTPTGREALARLLFDQGYDLVLAENGLQALQIARDIGPDVILLDVVMPGLDGYEVCQRLRADPRTAQIPILLITALDDRASRLRGIEAGADDFISKPYNRMELRARVRTITRLNRNRRLLAERAQFDWVVAQARDGYLIVDQHDRILYANDQARLYLDLSIEPGSATFRSAACRYRPEPLEAWADWPVTNRARAADRTRYLVRPESPTAQACWLEVKELDQPAGLDAQRLISLRDVTHHIIRRRSERTFQDAISHKLSAPLTYMLTSLGLLAQDLPELPPEEAMRLVRAALGGAQCLRDEVEEVLEFVNAPVLANTGERANWVCLPRLVAHVSEELALTSVTVHLADEIQDAPLILSEGALEWVLGELLENAKKFHPTQTPRIEVDAARAGADKVTLRVMDDGLTLAPEQLAQAWEPYFQGEKFFTGQVTGMGLGLSLVASLVWEANGACQLYNRADGPGVVVQITLPLAAAW